MHVSCKSSQEIHAKSQEYLQGYAILGPGTVEPALSNWPHEHGTMFCVVYISDECEVWKDVYRTRHNGRMHDWVERGRLLGSLVPVALHQTSKLLICKVNLLTLQP
jgi:hypothetical protein